MKTDLELKSALFQCLTPPLVLTPEQAAEKSDADMSEIVDALIQTMLLEARSGPSDLARRMMERVPNYLKSSWQARAVAFLDIKA